MDGDGASSTCLLGMTQCHHLAITRRGGWLAGQGWQAAKSRAIAGSNCMLLAGLLARAFRSNFGGRIGDLQHMRYPETG